MSKVATVERIINVRNHPNADTLDLIDVLGWQVCSKKGQGHEPGKLVIYINIDSIVKPNENFAWLEASNWRIKPIRLRQEPSNGLIMPLDLILKFDPNFDLSSLKEGDEVSEIIGAKHYEKPIDAKIAGFAKGNLPSFVSKTDEDNLRNYKNALDELKDTFNVGLNDIYLTLKIDGSSTTFYTKTNKEGVKEFGVCSRNLDLKEDDVNVFWKMAHKYNIKEKLMALPFDVYIQGETYGLGLNGNKLKEKDVHFMAFNVVETNPKTDKKYFGFDETKKFLSDNNIMMVPILDHSELKELDIPSLVAFANKQKYPCGSGAEGVVLRPKNVCYSWVLRKMFSVKILNEGYKDE